MNEELTPAVVEQVKAKRQANHYIDNQEFLAALLEHRERVQLAKESGEDPPRISNYLGDCFIKIELHQLQLQR